jgi:hypothetical protein
MSNKIMLPAILSGYRPKVDGSWSVTFSTNILKAEEKQIIDRMHQQLCCVMIKDSDILTEEIEAFDSVEMDLIDAKVTPSQRLRNVFYRLWEQEGKAGEFKEFYRVKMETLVEHYKQKLA